MVEAVQEMAQLAVTEVVVVEVEALTPHLQDRGMVDQVSVAKVITEVLAKATTTKLLVEAAVVRTHKEVMAQQVDQTQPRRLVMEVMASE